MSALPMTLHTTAETETAKIARGLRERDVELLADLVGRCQHRLDDHLRETRDASPRAARRVV